MAEKALGITDPTKAKEAFVKAVQDKDEAALTKISYTWSYGFDYTKYPSDPLLRLSSGAYVMKDLKENEYMTLEKNPKYTGDHKASIDTLTVRWNEDPMAQVQALQNGELDMFNPQVTTDVVKAAEKVKDVDIQKGLGGTFEHMDLVQNNKGPFDPATLRRRRAEGAPGPPGVPARCPAHGDRRQADQADHARRRGAQLLRQDRGHRRATTRSLPATVPPTTPRPTRRSRWRCSSRPA